MDKIKTIGIDARFFNEAGPGRYTKTIIEHLEKNDLKNKYLIFVRKRGLREYSPKNRNFKKVLADYKWYGFSEQTLFLVKLLMHRLDILYVPHFNIPVLYPLKIVTAIPDIIMHTYSTEKGTTLPLWYFKIKKFVYKLVVLWAVIRSKKVIVPSNDVLDDFSRYYKFISKNKYVLAYEGLDPVFLDDTLNHSHVLEDRKISKPYLLYVSSFYEHKNVYMLANAYKKLLDRNIFNGQLVMTGKKDNFSQRFKKYADETGLQNKIVLPGLDRYVSDAELVALRKEAELYVFASLKEGYSLTPLEAQAVGLPCVISDISCHREIYGDSVEYFDPNDADDIVNKIKKVLQSADLKKELIQKGYENVKRYDWNETAKATLNVFNNV